MVKIFIFILILLSNIEAKNYLRNNHCLWYDYDRKLAQITDITWNYCDFKCTYLEVGWPTYDFVVIYFKKIQNNDNGQIIGSCYVKDDGDYHLWSSIAKNKFYQSICGSDTQDYFRIREKYQLLTIKGIGIGVEIPQFQNVE